MGDLSHLKSVLVVEDEGLIRIDLEDTLLNAGADTVVSAASIGEAAAALEREPPDAAVLDLHLGRDGWSFELAQRLARLDIPFVFSSGSAEAPEGFADVPLLVKPFSGDQLVAALCTVTLRAAESRR